MMMMMIQALYDGSTSCVRVGNQMSLGFLVASGVRQGSVIAPAIGMDWLLERSVRRGMNGITFRQYAFTDLDFAYDMSFLAELLELLVPALEIPGGSCTTQSRSNLAKNSASSTGGSDKDEPSSLCICHICGHDVQRVESFVYL